MRIAIASDKTGEGLKRELLLLLLSEGVRDGFSVIDAGSQTIDEWPGVAYLMAKMVSSGAVDRGILICGSGMGMAIMANKVKGVYAAVCKDPTDAKELVESKGGNVMALGVLDYALANPSATALAFIHAERIDRPNARRMRELEAQQ